jgi:hypothetical protein
MSLPSADLTSQPHGSGPTPPATRSAPVKTPTTPGVAFAAVSPPLICARA